ncbi:MAG: FAD-binding oxidoreductase [Bacteroidetes bacterium]|nr:MAG: FAD-binding oxidoreductase [Bacteroidota bacterium]
MNLVSALLQQLPPQRVLYSLHDRLAYAGDAGFYELIPQVIVQVQSVEEVQFLFSISHQYQTPLVFRAGGTSLSGQSITNGILVDISKHWNKVEPLQKGELVWSQPGVTGAMVNKYLLPYGKKIGPDPSSISAAMMGGIVSNNASGMCCGVTYNSYHTMQEICFVLPNGRVYNTADANAREKFLTQETAVVETLTQAKQILAAKPALVNKIRHKYKTKNTVGYSLNALLDYDHPLDCFAHLLVGAEGTLGFIAHTVLKTIPNHPCNATAILYFNSIEAACSAIVPLKNTQADVLELMDRASLKSVEHLAGLPDFFKSLPTSAAALLCEYQAATKPELDQILANAQPTLAALPLLHHASFTQDAATRNFYWKIRKGMFPSVGAVRAKGATVILEDVTFPVEQLASAVLDLQNLFQEFGYDNAIIFGHAKDGNIHFVITQLLDTDAEIKRYDAFIKSLVNLVLHKYNGALKAEHGTGRNMSPFVEAEWGGELYAIMKQIKHTVDPQNLLNPDVIINHSTEAHIEHLKQLPAVEEEVDKCIECGMCEHHCPSKNITLTPRQRIQVRRQLKKLEKQGATKEYKEVLQQYQYKGLDTCATDGLCQSECPVEINTGDLVTRLRRENHSSTAKKVAVFIAKNYGTIETLGKVGIRLGAGINKLAGANTMRTITTTTRKISKQFPLWNNGLAAGKALPTIQPTAPSVVYFTACINRLMSTPNQEKTVQQAFLHICEAAGVQVLLPNNITSQCCGQPFSSKGFTDAALLKFTQWIDAAWVWSQQGTLPIVVDFTSCTYTFLKYKKTLPATYQQKFEQLQLKDIIAYLADLLPKLSLKKVSQTVVLHPTCSSQKMGLVSTMQQVAQACATQVIIPKNAGCCGMAGDRSFFVPELPASATLAEVAEVDYTKVQGCYSTGHTCEMALSEASGATYRNLVYLVYESLKK